MMYMFDIETIGVESTSVILSAAIIRFDPNDKERTYNQYLDDALFVKLSVEDQVTNYNRTIDKSTIEWWSKIHPAIRQVSFVPT